MHQFENSKINKLKWNFEKVAWSDPNWTKDKISFEDFSWNDSGQRERGRERKREFKLFKHFNPYSGN